MSDDIEYNVKGLDQLLKALKTKAPSARVGVLGDKNVRSQRGQKSGALTNADIGAIHEFGGSDTEARSFLRVPIADHLEKEIEKSGALDKMVMAEVIKSGTVIPWLKKIAVLAEGIVAEAFATGGFGKWKPSDMTHKKNHQTLVESQQLRNSITSEVKG